MVRGAGKRSPRHEVWLAVDQAAREAYIYLDALDRRTLVGLDVPLTPAQYHALAALEERPHQSLGTLAATLLCDKANASMLVGRLVALEVVVRATDPRDRRRVMLALTDAGRAALARARLARRAALEGALAPLEGAELRALEDHLCTLIALLRDAVETSGPRTPRGNGKDGDDMTNQDHASEAEPSVPASAPNEQAAAATPPGYLPFGEIAARLASQRWQFRHDNTTLPLVPQPGETVQVRATMGTVVPLDSATILYTTDGSRPDQRSAALPMSPGPVEWDAHAGYLRPWSATAPGQPAGTIVRYRIAGTAAGGGPVGEPHLWAQDGQGFHFRDSGEGRLTTFAYATEDERAEGPAWASDAVIYQIFLDRFHSGSLPGTLPAGLGPQVRHGGTLRGVGEALNYLTDLGVTCLWLSPLCRSETYHRYDTTDLYAVDPDLGTEEDLRHLVAAAHERGMRVLLDLVPNHCSWHHPAFLAAQRDRAAPTASWFTFEHWPDRYRSFLDAVPSLPAFNTDDPGARDHVIGSAVHWLRACGVDGFRLDHAIGPGMDFWVAFRAATRRENPACFTVGEATDTPDALRRYAGRLDSVLDFVLAQGLRSTFGAGEGSVAHLDGLLDAHAGFSSGGPGLVSFLDNHDMNRFLFVAGGNTQRLRLAALCQFSLPAVPALYYGTEIGMGQHADIRSVGDAEARKDMPWDHAAWDGDMLAFYKQVIRLRTSRAALRSPVRRRLHLDAANGTYAYLRTVTETGDAQAGVLVVFNLSDHQRTVALPLAAPAATVSCLLAAGPVPRLETAPGGLVVTLAPLSGALLGSR